MDIEFARKVQAVFGYNFVGDKNPGAKAYGRMDVAILSTFKCAMYIPVINFVAIGIIAGFYKSELFKRAEGHLILARMAISFVAAPILLPIDIIATVALRVFIAHQEKAKKFSGIV